MGPPGVSGGLGTASHYYQSLRLDLTRHLNKYSLPLWLKVTNGSLELRLRPR